MKRETKKFILQELDDYVYSCEELKKLYLEIEATKKAPTGKYSNRELEFLETRIKHLERIVTTVETMSLTLSKDLNALFVARFIEKPQKTDKEICEAYHMSLAKYYRDLKVIVDMVARRLGIK